MHLGPRGRKREKSNQGLCAHQRWPTLPHHAGLQHWRNLGRTVSVDSVSLKLPRGLHHCSFLRAPACLRWSPPFPTLRCPLVHTHTPPQASSSHPCGPRASWPPVGSLRHEPEPITAPGKTSKLLAVATMHGREPKEGADHAGPGVHQGCFLLRCPCGHPSPISLGQKSRDVPWCICPSYKPSSEAPATAFTDQIWDTWQPPAARESGRVFSSRHAEAQNILGSIRKGQGGY